VLLLSLVIAFPSEKDVGKTSVTKVEFSLASFLLKFASNSIFSPSFLNLCLKSKL